MFYPLNSYVFALNLQHFARQNIRVYTGNQQIMDFNRLFNISLPHISRIFTECKQKSKQAPNLATFLRCFLPKTSVFTPYVLQLPI